MLCPVALSTPSPGRGKIANIRQAVQAPFFMLGEGPGWGGVIYTVVRYWKGFRMKRGWDNGIDLALFSPTLKILNNPEDSANDPGRKL